MEECVRRAVAFAAVASVSLLAPAIEVLVAVPFALIAVAGRTVSEGRLFELFARPSDRRAGELRGLVGFALVATALALLVALADPPNAWTVFVSTILILGYGNLAEQTIRSRLDTQITRATAFVIGGTLATGAGIEAFVLIADSTIPDPMVSPPTAVFLGLAGSITGALVRAISLGRDDQLTVVTVAAALGLLVSLDLTIDPLRLGVAVAVAGTVGYLSWRLETASITGMLAGVLLSLATIVLGGYGWFAVLIAFFGIGGLASKYRYEEKRDLGVAEDNEGARGSWNVLGNAGIALVAVTGFAATDATALDESFFRFLFLGSLSTAMSDTLSSEIGVLFGPPRLITTLEPVDVGTDGGVTLKGVGVGGVGGAVVAVIALPAATFGISLASAGVIVAAGVLGMLVDSILGATIEGRWIGNQAVNFLATLAGGIIAAAGTVAFALV
ncbi:MAG: TIGR00297 family protein [Halobacteriales archaeon]